MSHMEPQVIGPCNWFEIDSNEGISFVPEDYFTLAQIIDMYDCDEADVTTKHGFGARMSAPGYLDVTEWSVFDTEQEAEEYLKEYYGDEDEDEEIEDNE